MSGAGPTRQDGGGSGSAGGGGGFNARKGPARGSAPRGKRPALETEFAVPSPDGVGYNYKVCKGALAGCTACMHQ